MQEAKKIWSSKGEALGNITKGSKEDCKYYYNLNSIVITGLDRNIDLEKEYACTVNLVGDQKIKASHIELSKDIDLYIVAHEFGHALGYGHNEIHNDLMNAEY